MLGGGVGEFGDVGRFPFAAGRDQGVDVVGVRHAPVQPVVGVDVLRVVLVAADHHRVVVAADGGFGDREDEGGLVGAGVVGGGQGHRHGAGGFGRVDVVQAGDGPDVRGHGRQGAAREVGGEVELEGSPDVGVLRGDGGPGGGGGTVGRRDAHRLGPVGRLVARDGAEREGVFGVRLEARHVEAGDIADVVGIDHVADGAGDGFRSGADAHLVDLDALVAAARVAEFNGSGAGNGGEGRVGGGSGRSADDGGAVHLRSTDIEVDIAGPAFAEGPHVVEFHGGDASGNRRRGERSAGAEDGRTLVATAFRRSPSPEVATADGLGTIAAAAGREFGVCERFGQRFAGTAAPTAAAAGAALAFDDDKFIAFRAGNGRPDGGEALGIDDGRDFRRHGLGERRGDGEIFGRTAVGVHGRDSEVVGAGSFGDEGEDAVFAQFGRRIARRDFEGGDGGFFGSRNPDRNVQRLADQDFFVRDGADARRRGRIGHEGDFLHVGEGPLGVADGAHAPRVVARNEVRDRERGHVADIAREDGAGRSVAAEEAQQLLLGGVAHEARRAGVVLEHPRGVLGVLGAHEAVGQRERPGAGGVGSPADALGRGGIDELAGSGVEECARGRVARERPDDGGVVGGYGGILDGDIRAGKIAGGRTGAGVVHRHVGPVGQDHVFTFGELVRGGDQPEGVVGALRGGRGAGIVCEDFQHVGRGAGDRAPVGRERGNGDAAVRELGRRREGGRDRHVRLAVGVGRGVGAEEAEGERAVGGGREGKRAAGCIERVGALRSRGGRDGEGDFAGGAVAVARCQRVGHLLAGGHRLLGNGVEAYAGGRFLADPAEAHGREDGGVGALRHRVVFAAGLAVAVRVVLRDGVVEHFLEGGVGVAVAVGALVAGAGFDGTDVALREGPAFVAVPRILVVVGRRHPSAVKDRQLRRLDAARGLVGADRRQLLVDALGEREGRARVQVTGRAVAPEALEHAAGMAGVQHDDDLHAGLEVGEDLREGAVRHVLVVHADARVLAAVLVAVGGVVVEHHVAADGRRGELHELVGDRCKRARRVEELRRIRRRPLAAQRDVRVDVLGVRNASVQPAVGTHVAGLVLVQPRAERIMLRLRGPDARQGDEPGHSHTQPFSHDSVPLCRCVRRGGHFLLMISLRPRRQGGNPAKARKEKRSTGATGKREVFQRLEKCFGRFPMIGKNVSNGWKIPGGRTDRRPDIIPWQAGSGRGRDGGGACPGD